MQTKREWLDALKAGDEVAIHSNQGSSSSFGIGKVLRRTPTLIIVETHKATADNRAVEQRFRAKCGSGFTGNIWSGNSIELVTNEIREGIKRQRLENFFHGFDFTQLSTEKLIKILEVIKSSPC